MSRDSHQPRETFRGRIGSPTSDLPLYHQVATVIRARISEGEYGPGEQIPSEAALAAAFHVSVVTVRQALAMLSDEGILNRYQGRGTFVADAQDLASEVRLAVPLDQIMAGISGSTVEPIDWKLVTGPRSIVSKFGGPADEPIVRTRRVRFSSDGAPISYAVSYFPRWLGEGLTEADLRELRLLDVLERRFGATFQDAVQTIEATVADPESASALGVPIGSPLLLVHRDYRLDDGRIGYVATNRYPSHLFRYRMLLLRNGPGTTDWGLAKADEDPGAAAELNP